MDKLKELSESIISGKKDQVEQLTQQSLDEGIVPREILNNGLLAGMEVVGKKFKANEFYVPEVLIAARAMKAGMQILKPKLADTGVEPIARVLLGTVKGDLHDIGKNLVGMMLEGGGFEVIDAGVDVGPEKFVELAKENKTTIIGMSALLTTTMVNMKSAVEALKGSELKDQVKIIVGGAPVTDSYATEIGADGYAPDAASSVDLAKSLI
jgi:5-methyltetrahydrofolate--homocysteine methyltransferase